MSDDVKETTKEKASPSKVLLIALMVNMALTVALAGGGAVLFLRMRSTSAKAGGESHAVDKKSEPSAEHGSGEVDEDGKPVTGRPPPIKIEPVTIRLKNPELDRYARGTFVFELETNAAYEKWKDVEPKILDMIGNVMSDLFAEDLSGSSGRDKLKTSVFKGAEGFIGEGQLRAVYLTDFIVQ